MVRSLCRSTREGTEDSGSRQRPPATPSPPDPRHLWSVPPPSLPHRSPLTPHRNRHDDQDLWPRDVFHREPDRRRRRHHRAQSLAARSASGDHFREVLGAGWERMGADVLVRRGRCWGCSRDSFRRGGSRLMERRPSVRSCRSFGGRICCLCFLVECPYYAVLYSALRGRWTPSDETRRRAPWTSNFSR